MEDKCISGTSSDFNMQLRTALIWLSFSVPFSSIVFLNPSFKVCFFGDFFNMIGIE